MDNSPEPGASADDCKTASSLVIAVMLLLANYTHVSRLIRI